MTTAVANAIAITLDKQARAAFDRAVRFEDAEAGQTPSEFHSTVTRLASMFPGAVTIH